MAHSTYGRAGEHCNRTRGFLLVACIAALGCEQEEIRHYRVPKPEVLYAQNHVEPADTTASDSQAALEPKDRLLGAIVPHGSQTWFFKMTGPMALVAQQEPAFRQLIESVTFDAAESDPKWTLPESWQENAGSGPRFATLSVDVEGERLEISVTQLPTGPAGAGVFANVNRWRRQMQLPSLRMSDLDKETTTLDLHEGTAILVDLIGNFSSSMGSPAPTKSRPAAPSKPQLKFEAPPGWTTGAPAMFSALTLNIGDEDRMARITVSPFKGDAGGLLANVNQWHTQVGREAISDETLEKTAEEMKVSGITGSYVEVLGDAEQARSPAIIGWIGIEAEGSWFVKLAGDLQLVQEQREPFRTFLKTLEFKAP